MKKTTYFSFAALLCILAFTGFKPADEWQVYTSREGKFTILFPGKAEESVQNDTTAAGVPFKINFATYSATDNEVYMAGWIDMNNFYPEGKTIQQMLDDSRDGAVESMHAANVVTLETVTIGEPYIEFTFQSDDFVGKDRIYLIHKFQYSIITIFSKSVGIPGNADKFIKSFRSL